MFDTTRFIMEVQQRECIWNVESPLYYNREVKRDAWIDIFNIMLGKRGHAYEELSSTEQLKEIYNLQKKWKNIRDQFKKCRRFCRSSSAFRAVKPYLYADLLGFLIPVLESQKCDVSLESEEPSMEELNEQIIKDEESNDDHLSIVPICEVKQKRNHNDLSESTKRLKKNSENKSGIEKENLSQCRFETVTKEEEEPEKLFLLSLLPQIRPLNNDQKNFLYIEILQSIQKAKYFKYPVDTKLENQEC